MLDTNILSDLIRNPFGPAASTLARHGVDGLCVSIVAAAELRFGAAKAAARAGQATSLGTRVESLLGSMNVVPFSSPADRAYAELRSHTELQGMTIGANDLFIAAHALALDVTLVTHDAAFARVPGLRLEDWLA